MGEGVCERDMTSAGQVSGWRTHRPLLLGLGQVGRLALVLRLLVGRLQRLHGLDEAVNAPPLRLQVNLGQGRLAAAATAARALQDATAPQNAAQVLGQGVLNLLVIDPRIKGFAHDVDLDGVDVDPLVLACGQQHLLLDGLRNGSALLVEDQQLPGTALIHLVAAARANLVPRLDCGVARFSGEEEVRGV